MSCEHETEWCKTHTHCETCGYYESSNLTTATMIADGAMYIRVPKDIARIKICGGGLTFTINDTMQFEMPTKEQCENLKKTFGIEVELIEDD